MEYLKPLIGIIIIAITLVIYFRPRFTKKKKLEEMIDVLSFIKDKRELEEIVKEELRKRGESATDENIISFLENNDNEELLSKKYEKINNAKKNEFKNVVESLIHSKKRDLL